MGWPAVFETVNLNIAKTKEGNMGGKKRIFISDVHMNAGWSLAPQSGKYCYDWLGKSEAEDFAAFLASLLTYPDLEEVVFIGDLMDNWVCPVDQAPPTFDDIVNAPGNQEIVQQLKKLCKTKGIRVVYLPGNHDMGVTKEFIESKFEGMIFGGTAHFNSSYCTGRVRAEHGSAHAMFNSPDPLNSPANRIPLGYYISRVAATRMHNTEKGDRHICSYVDDLLETLGPQKLPASVFEAMLEEAKLKESVTIITSPRGVEPLEEVYASVIKERYANLYEQWQQQYGPGLAYKAVMAEIGWLEDAADRLCKKSGTNVVIFGHSHDWDLDKDAWFVDDRIYANCGTWCDGKERTFVETQKDRDEKIQIVRVMEWKDGKVSELAMEFLDL
jgi:UDP-2,3-diacylglucosamine pyrophosphatase LpxH